MMRVLLSGALAALIVGSGAATSSQDAKQEYDLIWKLPHDRAAVYDVFDGTKGTKKGDFWLLGCELEKPIAITDYRELWQRFVFRRFPPKIKIGVQWEVKEWAFADAAGTATGIRPVQAVGSYVVRAVRKARVEDVFKVAFKERKEKSEPVELALIEGSIQVFRAERKDTGEVEVIERRASTMLAVMIGVRASDGAILGARASISGRGEHYQGRFDFFQVSKLNESIELALRDPIVAMDREGLRGRVDDAVARGVKWLKAQQHKDGKITDPTGYPLGTAFGIGSTALCLMALVHSGVALNDPVIQGGYSYLAGRRAKESYDLALVILAIEAKYLPLSMLEDVEKFTEEAARAKVRKDLSGEDKEIVSNAVKGLLATQDASGLFGYAGASIPNLSNTQYAVLALHAAARMGVEVPVGTWKQVMKAIEKCAQPSGKGIELHIRHRNGTETVQQVREVGWGYGEKISVTGTMTCAAIACIAICESALLRAKALTDVEARRYDELMWGGWAWVQNHYTMRAGTPEGCGTEAAMLLYYMYGIERCGIIWDVDRLGGHDWFHEGAAVLLSLQDQQGKWTGPHGWSVVDTAWALLFLKRATVSVETPARVASVDKSKKEPQEAPREKQDK